jgi:hypothetical protein
MSTVYVEPESGRQSARQVIRIECFQDVLVGLVKVT